MKTFHIKTWGCQMNYSDTDAIREALLSRGLKEVDSFELSDIAILNTCSVRQRAEDKVSGIGRRLIEIKKNNPNFRVVMTGCMSQRINRQFNVENKGYRTHIQNQFDWVDYFVPIGDEGTLLDVIGVELGNKVKDVNLEKNVVGYVPISMGCDNFCSYCVVPFSRGGEESIDIDLIKGQVEKQKKRGSKIVFLLGQNVNSWESGGREFPDLLELVAKENRNIWISFLTSHPTDFNEDLIRVMKKNKNICRYLNLPVQSGSDTVLKRMNRKYTRSEYLNKVRLIQKEIPSIRLSTDIIVGFSSETEDDFVQTLNLVKQVGFSMAYISEYSSREGTAGFVLDDNVPQNVKKERKERLNDVIISQSRRFNQKFIGKNLEVIVTGKGIGKTFDFTDVRIDSNSIGSNVNVKITKASECGLEGKVVV
ncbi:MAG: MiaB/RimO family radical SAM methylthiotransferase [bacterium]